MKKSSGRADIDCVAAVAAAVAISLSSFKTTKECPLLSLQRRRISLSLAFFIIGLNSDRNGFRQQITALTSE
jgi:hypothetical protein